MWSAYESVHALARGHVIWVWLETWYWNVYDDELLTFNYHTWEFIDMGKNGEM